MNAPSDPPPCCANSASVSVPFNVFARYVTALPYKTPEWKRHYRDTRNQMEGKNRFIKNPLDADIASSGERRFRGFGKQLFALLTKLVSANIQTLVGWLDANDAGEHEPPIKRRGRRPEPGLDQYRPRPTGPPIRVVGPAPAA